MPDTTGYQVTIGERVVLVELRREGELTYARVDGGDERPVQLGTVHGALRSLGIGAQRAELLAARSGEAVRVCLGGLDFRAEVLDARRARLAAVAGAAGPGGHARRELKAPMPGLVVKLLCQVGETVADGQPLAVLQAMKMENELSLPRGGVVQSINAEPGQTVEQGQVLVVLE
jgi:biotin carboxyl carrier protein